MAIATGRRTLYELVAENGDQRTLIMYTSGTSRRMLWECACKHGDKLVALTGEERMAWEKNDIHGAHGKMGAWTIRWSGRTQREAQDSKLPWIGDYRKINAAFREAANG